MYRGFEYNNLLIDDHVLMFFKKSSPISPLRSISESASSKYDLTGPELLIRSTQITSALLILKIVALRRMLFLKLARLSKAQNKLLVHANELN